MADLAKILQKKIFFSLEGQPYVLASRKKKTNGYGQLSNHNRLHLPSASLVARQPARRPPDLQGSCPRICKCGAKDFKARIRQAKLPAPLEKTA